MASKTEEIKKDALQLPEKERAALAVDLIRSLDDEEDPDAELAWKDEVERRIREIKEGKEQGKPVDDVIRQLRSQLE